MMARLALVAIMAAMIVATAACGGEEPAPEGPLEGVWVGRLLGEGIWSGVVVRDGEAAVFLCGDGDKLETHSRWMRGQPADRVVDVAADGFALTADLSGEPALEMTEPDGTVHIEFDLQLAPPDELTGVYTSFDSGCQDGVIVFSSNADGSQVNTLGAWCDDQGNFSRVTPILPWIFESSLQAEIVDPATGERPITFQEAIPTAIQP